jgi:hypothetical protein
MNRSLRTNSWHSTRRTLILYEVARWKHSSVWLLSNKTRQSRFILIIISKKLLPILLITSRTLCAPRRCRSLQVQHSKPKMLLSYQNCLSISTTARSWQSISLRQHGSHFVRCIAISTLLHIGWDSLMGALALHHLKEYLSPQPSFKVAYSIGN